MLDWWSIRLSPWHGVKCKSLNLAYVISESVPVPLGLIGSFSFLKLGLGRAWAWGFYLRLWDKQLIAYPICNKIVTSFMLTKSIIP